MVDCNFDFPGIFYYLYSFQAYRNAIFIIFKTLRIIHRFIANDFRV